MKNWYKRNSKLITHLAVSQFQPLRLIFYLFLPSVFFAQLEINWQPAVLIFNNLHFLIAANIIFILIVREDEFRKLGTRNSFSLILFMFVGIFTIEFVGFFIHTMITFHEVKTPAMKFWNIFGAGFSGLGGLILEVYYFYSEKLSHRIENNLFVQHHMKFIKISLITTAISLNLFALLQSPLIKPYLSSTFP